jgi:hypothetical protein
LWENGWRVFLVKVRNEAGVTAPLKVASEQAGSVPNTSPLVGRDRWLDVRMFDDRPLAEQLSGLELEYRIIQLYSRDAGKRAAVLAFDVGQGTQDLGFRSDVLVTFDCRPATNVTLRVLDEVGQAAMASFIIRDPQGQTYPAQSKRLAPDFFFHPQVYRADREQVKLPPGEYTVTCGRGPEYLAETRPIEVGREPLELAFHLQRWIDPAAQGWWSGDHHIHAAGCAHYTQPTEGDPALTIKSNSLQERRILFPNIRICCGTTWR